MFATVITDASFCPRTKAAGWAAWATSNAGRIRKSGTFRKNPETPFEAEYWASCNGINLAAVGGATTVLIQTDCKGVVDAINNNRGVISEIRRRHPDLVIRAKHVKGHTLPTDPGADGTRFHVNRWCDENAKKEMRHQRQFRS